MTNEVLVADQLYEYKDVHSSFEKLLSPKGKKKSPPKKKQQSLPGRRLCFWQKLVPSLTFYL